MTKEDSRSVTSWVTLAAMAAVTLVMAVWGFNALTAPVEKDPAVVGPETDSTACTPTDAQFIRRSDVTVSVYNAGKKTGRAQETLDLLERAGFTAGAIGNAPEGTRVAKVEVRAKRADDPAAQLVALAFGKSTEVTVADDDLGPGVVIFIGDKFKKLDPDAPLRVRTTAAVACTS